MQKKKKDENSLSLAARCYLIHAFCIVSSIDDLTYYIMTVKMGASNMLPTFSESQEGF